MTTTKKKAAISGAWLFVLFTLGIISKPIYCQLCNRADATCASVCTPTPEPTPTPTPEPTPTPTPPPAECLPNIPWCNELVPPAQCSSAAQPCKHNPTSDPAHCELAPACDPTPEPTTPPTPGPTPTPDDLITAVTVACGLPMPNGVSSFVKLKPYGQGLDTELNVLNWPALCIKIHGNPVNPNQCHLEGHPNRVQCEMAIINLLSDGKGKCPVGIYRTATVGERRCEQVDPYDRGGMSCDHFGNTVDRDDPHTLVFEGKPVECSEQRDAAGNPSAGFFWIGHGDGEMKACLPDYSTGCSRQWVRVVH